MAKFGIGVGEDFPVDEPTPRGSARPPHDHNRPEHERHEHGRWHRVLHLATRLTFLALMIAAIVWLLSPHPMAWHGPYAFAPTHHHFFFPFFPVLLIALIVFAFRHRRHHHRPHYHQDWHHHSRHHHGEGA